MCGGRCDIWGCITSETCESASSTSRTTMSPTALVFIADGTEEMELCVIITIQHVDYNMLTRYSTITYDTLVRGGIECTSALVGSTSQVNVATCSRGVRILPDATLDSADVTNKTVCDVLLCLLPKQSSLSVIHPV